VSARELITEHLDLWTGAVTKRSSSGRGSNSKVELTGIKKLRELVLELAVRGQLVEQRPDEEPSSILLEYIGAQKAQLVNEGRLKKPKKLPPITNEEILFQLPTGWSWARLEAVSVYTQRGKGPKYADSGKVRVISQKCVQWSGFDLNPAKFVDDSSLKGYQDERYIRENDVLWNSTGTGTVGRAIVVAEPSCPIVADSHVTIIRLLSVNSAHILNYICSPSVQQRIEPDHENALVSGTTNQVELNAGSVKLLPVPIPPLEEQHRIVQKVDELMALCDRLEQQTSDQLEAHETIVDTLLGTLTQSENATELADNWARLATHFDTLFTTEQSIDKLKQAILQLAVMGRLVEQDAGDEPAALLFSKIHQRKTTLSKSGKLKKPKAVTKLNESQHSYSAPSHWAWAIFQDVADEISTGPFGSMIHKHDYIDNGTPLINPSHMVNGHIKEDASISVSPSKTKELSSYRLAEGDIVMARRGEVGRCAIVSDREAGWLCGTGSFVLRFHPDVDRQFVLLLFTTETVRDYLTGNSVGTTMTNLNHGILKKMPVALPSAGEQHRIVQKVDELMALCDQLKQRLNQASETRCQLARTIVEQAVH
jgi:type I restriction enzyme S subunit